MTQPSASPKKPSPRRQTKFYVGGAVVVLAMAYLIITGLRSGSSYYLTIAELQAEGAGMVDKPVRVSAAVDKETIDYDVESLTLRFDLVDKEGRLPVMCRGIKPDLLTASQSAVAEGHLLNSGLFQAEAILVKCPSKYEEVADEGTVQRRGDSDGRYH